MKHSVRNENTGHFAVKLGKVTVHCEGQEEKQEMLLWLLH